MLTLLLLLILAICLMAALAFALEDDYRLRDLTLIGIIVYHISRPSMWIVKKLFDILIK